MGWVVKTWRVEDALRAAERETRRLGRIAARETADAAAHLDALEQVGEETLRMVRARRAGARPEARLVVAPEPLTVRARRNPRRASLRESPLNDLLKATADR